MVEKGIKKKMMFIILVLLAIIVVIILAPIALKKLWRGNLTVETSDIKEYGDFNNFAGHSDLRIFPELLPESLEQAKYYYFFEDTMFDPTIQIYLECTYDNIEEYHDELDRLSKIENTYKEVKKEVKYDSEHFQFPAYVSILANNNTYEYVLLLENQRIAYIYLQHIKPENIKIDVNYLPKKYEQDGELDPYTIYIFYEKNGDGTPVYR